MVYDTQNCWGFGLYPSSGFLIVTRKKKKEWLEPIHPFISAYPSLPQGDAVQHFSVVSGAMIVILCHPAFYRPKTHSRIIINIKFLCCGSVVVSCCCEKLVAEVGDSEEGARSALKPLPSNGSEDATVDTGLCVCVCVCVYVTVNCEV
jgi:hypothetical protein